MKRGVSDAGAATSPGPSKVQKIAAERGGGSDVRLPFVDPGLMLWSGFWGWVKAMVCELGCAYCDVSPRPGRASNDMITARSTRLCVLSRVVF